MGEIKAEYKKYITDCIYNIDEIGYYQKMKPNCSLLIFEESNKKKVKLEL